jgi:hypothetical protein
MIDRLREAADALNAGDPGPLVALMDDDVDWRRRFARPPVVEAHTLVTRPG